MTEFIIGRKGNQPFTISENCYHVSNEHARIIIDDGGKWWIEDLNSTNGTYVQDEENGVFIRVESKCIGEFQRISLGGTKVGCFSFLAHHVLEAYSNSASEDSDNYCKEFMHVIELHKGLTEKKEALERKQKRKSRLKMIPPLLIPLIGLPLYFLGKNDARIAITYVIAQLGALIPPMIDIFSKEKKQLTLLKTYISRVCLCPHCGIVLSDLDFQRESCSRCKAHA